MRTVRTKVYKFSELSEPAKQKAIDKLIEINVDYEWWDSIYEDARNIGLKITSFDDYKVDGKFIVSPYFTADKCNTNHGPDCETYKDSVKYLAELEKLEETNLGWNDEQIEDLDRQFLYDMCENYRIILSKGYNYLTSTEAIIESIEANEYEFTQDGRRF